ncbi:Protein kinase alk2 [Mortierella sp. AD031]|nr:Protein kinase alk2 [Mortierella sp. AD031]
MNVAAGAISRASSASPTFKKFLQQLTRKNLSRVLVVYILAVIVKYRNTAYGVKPRPDLKGPRGHPLIGNMILMALIPRNQVSQQNERMHEEFGSTWSFSVPKLGRIIQFKDPAVLEHVLKTNFWAYEKGPLLQETLSDLLGLGIFGADGHSWHWQRKMASHIFNVKAFRNYTSTVFVKESNIVTDYLGTMADEGKVVDIHNLFYLYTLDSFGEISFGQTFGCLKTPEEEVEFAAAFDRLNTVVFNRLFAGSYKFREWVTGEAKQVTKDKKIITDFALNVIRHRRVHGYDKPQKDLLQLCMDVDGDDGKPLSDEMLKDLVLNFIIAGRDTTAQALSWMFYLLHRSQTDPSIVKKLVTEVDNVLRGEDPTYDSCKTMKYAEACLYEALRLYPSVPRNIKIAVKDDVWPDGTKVYKGEFVSWSSWAMGRATEVWGPDAKEYNPDRWMQGEKFSAHKFPAFHAGPRTCLGQQFATVEGITIMAMLFQKFSFELVDPLTEPGYVPGLTLPMADGLRLRVKRRVV